MTEPELVMKPTYPESKNLCPLNDFKPCIRRDCAFYDVFNKCCSIIGIANLQGTVWKLMNIFKYSNEKGEMRNERREPTIR